MAAERNGASGSHFRIGGAVQRERSRPTSGDVPTQIVATIPFWRAARSECTAIFLAGSGPANWAAEPIFRGERRLGVAPSCYSGYQHRLPRDLLADEIWQTTMTRRGRVPWGSWRCKRSATSSTTAASEEGRGRQLVFVRGRSAVGTPTPNDDAAKDDDDNLGANHDDDGDDVEHAKGRTCCRRSVADRRGDAAIRRCTDGGPQPPQRFHRDSPSMEPTRSRSKIVKCPGRYLSVDLEFAKKATGDVQHAQIISGHLPSTVSHTIDEVGTDRHKLFSMLKRQRYAKFVGLDASTEMYPTQTMPTTSAATTTTDRPCRQALSSAAASSAAAMLRAELDTTKMMAVTG